uniref:Uncharacterized protein n=1 Tax=Oryza sativa subsp. japonica TaxID=39947 RepID=Q6Z261_ORYSJ|nr:hypothetical protein [Oryza sativa Japonica Group]BAD03533.1 hypothetical protein [Oryza sativa Japonica Group]
MAASRRRPSGGDCGGSCGCGARGRAADSGVVATLGSKGTRQHGDGRWAAAREDLTDEEEEGSDWFHGNKGRDTRAAGAGGQRPFFHAWLPGGSLLVESTDRTLDEQRRRGGRAGQQQPRRRAQPAEPLLAEQQAVDGTAGAQRPVHARSRRRSRCRGELERRHLPLRDPRLAVRVEDVVAEQVAEDGVPEGGRPPPLSVNRSNPGEVRKRGGRRPSPAPPLASPPSSSPHARCLRRRLTLPPPPPPRRRARLPALAASAAA